MTVDVRPGDVIYINGFYIPLKVYITGSTNDTFQNNQDKRKYKDLEFLIEIKVSG